MRRIKALFSASLLAAGPAFAGHDSTVQGSVETSPPEMLSEQYLEPVGRENPEWLSLREEEALMLEEENLAIPGESSEMPQSSEMPG
jgi:hypothetical protein